MLVDIVTSARILLSIPIVLAILNVSIAILIACEGTAIRMKIIGAHGKTTCCSQKRVVG